VSRGPGPFALAALAALLGGALAACTSDPSGTPATTYPTIDVPIESLPPTTTTTTTTNTTAVPPTPAPATTGAPTTTVAPTTTQPVTTLPAVTTTSLPPTTTTTTTTTPPAATTTAPSGTTPYGMPVVDVASAGYGRTHSGYPATDIFLGCGAVVVAPVNGTILEIRRENKWVAAIDNPATRGGRSISLLGDDGVRYYFAHFNEIVQPLVAGQRVSIGDRLGLLGMTGRASACHLHFAISPPCPGKEWSVRRGVVYPWKYLDSWKTGGQLSPVDEVRRWVAEHPNACADAMADPNAGDS
jgi:peptidoglycan LD-endopeptidase LytH